MPGWLDPSTTVIHRGLVVTALPTGGSSSRAYDIKAEAEAHVRAARGAGCREVHSIEDLTALSHEVMLRHGVTPPKRPPRSPPLPHPLGPPMSPLTQRWIDVGRPWAAGMLATAWSSVRRVRTAEYEEPTGDYVGGWGVRWTEPGGLWMVSSVWWPVLEDVETRAIVLELVGAADEEGG